MRVAACLMSLWSGDLTVLPATSNSLCWRLRNSTPWKLTSFHIQEALETSTPMGRAMFTIIAATAELERDVIRERTTAGFEYARYHRTKSGKPIGRPRAVFRHDQVLQLHGEGISGREIGRRLGVGEGTVR